ncbi:UNVERIFIED_ORG: glycine betaine/proline transport system permease protein [Kosakonia oryzae]|uniref:Glycine betaine/proline transport system permease protein n=1 Tax=Kosakonia radicincitans TaxID=283686 RepID=A0AAX2EWT7_9ENTR|nr:MULTISPECIES: ABC transporter permease subunit [Kosakonia]MDP9568601.1 glycine betaine/proline transport system permease protein [Kosakonia oryzae]NCF05148.1 ABC transporter permease subunit [Kosakonia sp. MH5]SFF20558.1 glycine betaine/proline transport system permease protein [Kosakonia radicincitans]SFR23100.1 glycine betaine/proline transport system permease protein [Kosakonia radicincitans]SFU01427.1 glycine betaine/proline transport system permease protein [Kosakonia radicincitans]
MAYPLDFSRQIDDAVHALLAHAGGLFDGIARIIDLFAGGLEQLIIALSPWGLVTLAVVIGAWRIGKGFALFALLATLYIIYSGYSDHAAITLALTLSSTFFSLLLGIPLGIWSARRAAVGSVVRTLLDFMQTMPAFVYLIPATILFGLGRPPGIFATILFSMPPVVRLTDLGIRQVNSARLEAGIAFGCTPWQLLWKVQLPAAQPSIMAGVNQTIMMAMSMVIIASMVGAGGLGNDILSSIQQLEIGLGLQSGVVVVLMAILLDRLSASFARRPADQ